MLKRSVLSVFALVLLAGPAPAEPASRERLILLFKVMASYEECEFPLARTEAAAASAAAVAAIADLKLAQEAADKLFEDTRTHMDHEGWDKLCDRDGPWAATWRNAIAALPK